RRSFGRNIDRGRRRALARRPLDLAGDLLRALPVWRTCDPQGVSIMTSTLRFEPLISPAVWLLLAVVGIALVVWYARGRPSSVEKRTWFGALGLWGLGLAGALVVLLNPVWIERAAPPAGKPSLTILVDASSSMGVSEGSPGRSRFQQAAEAARSLLKQTEEAFDVRLATFAGRPTPTDLNGLSKIDPTGASTDLASAIIEN